MDPSSFPKQYGGELDWQWGDVPNLDEPTRERLQGLETDPAEGQSRKGILKGPMLFQGDRIEVLGMENGMERRMTIPVPKLQAEAETQTNGIPIHSIQATAETHANGTVTEPISSALTDENEKTALETVAVNGDQVPGHHEVQKTTAAA